MQPFESEIIRCVDPWVNMHIPENIEQSVCQWNKDEINLLLMLTDTGWPIKTKENILEYKLEQTKSKHRGAQGRKGDWKS